MASSAVTKLALVVALCMAVSVVHAITCGQVTSNLGPCINYVKRGGAVPPACCNGIRTINGLARTTADRQTTCNCLKNLAGSISGVNPNNAAALPGKCGVNVPFKISTSTNCATLGQAQYKPCSRSPPSRRTRRSAEKGDRQGSIKDKEKKKEKR